MYKASRPVPIIGVTHTLSGALIEDMDEFIDELKRREIKFRHFSFMFIEKDIRKFTKTTMNTLPELQQHNYVGFVEDNYGKSKNVSPLLIKEQFLKNMGHDDDSHWNLVSRIQDELKDQNSPLAHRNLKDQLRFETRLNNGKYIKELLYWCKEPRKYANIKDVKNSTLPPQRTGKDA